MRTTATVDFVKDGVAYTATYTELTAANGGDTHIIFKKFRYKRNDVPLPRDLNIQSLHASAKAAIRAAAQ